MSKLHHLYGKSTMHGQHYKSSVVPISEPTDMIMDPLDGKVYNWKEVQADADRANAYYPPPANKDELVSRASRLEQIYLKKKEEWVAYVNSQKAEQNQENETQRKQITKSFNIMKFQSEIAIIVLIILVLVIFKFWKK